MTGSKRPKLGAVLRGELPEPRQEAPLPAPEPAEIPAVEKMVQLNVTVPDALRRSLRVRALQRGEDVGVVVRRLLQQWVEQEDG